MWWQAWAAMPADFAVVCTQRFCWQLATALSSLSPALRRAGVRLAAISAGTPSQAQLFLHESGFQGELFVDPERDPARLYNAYRAFRWGTHVLSLSLPLSLSLSLSLSVCVCVCVCPLLS
jgi:peroxiredoxin